MAANYAESFNRVSFTSRPSREVIFAGDNVRLAGQIDYPTTPMPDTGYPLVVVIPHSGCNTRNDYTHYASVALQSGYAVFRWDKRGTGRSGASGLGSTIQDAINAYATGVKQECVDTQKVIILAQGEGTLLLSEAFEAFADVQPPFGALLIGNMLDQKQILSIRTRVQVIIGSQDWINWQTYGKAPCDAHNAFYKYGARFAVAHHADRLLMDTRKTGQPRIHIGAKQIIKEWLQTLGEL